MSSVVIKSIDRQHIHRAVTTYAAALRKQHPEIQRVIWFGSWVTGLPSPGSDVDLCLILSSSEKPPQDRIPDYLPFGFPVGLDLFIYTLSEFDRLEQTSPGWRQAILSGTEI